ncbi:TetR family transcriptional regulator C-terminal domain-containing protein [Alkalilimnicola ehrlichii MLHE-1]|uniref:Transcriptional regulator, TetR family n=1 Tax=Alkalilimnicola ehrlichii (strain ATCC BAA-1101 / DSM 17681 / MLHE-1) TaxID=187272 RepID=Q0AC74_ALKEH|nr:TetR/AcrR family transcriptional regulator [Alkalilimnicola ehrlichii]ABI55563.1 transcriptional regulator, TetR family [Alkalilimnicola ehrlichii MLHE-1]
MRKDTKQRLLEVGLDLLLQHGYNDLGVQTLLTASGVPKGSFYHHFRSKQDFALQVVDRYMREVHAGLDACLSAPERAPLERIHTFFALSLEKYGREGYRGCLLGNLGQELSAASDVFRYKIEWCFAEITARIAVCLEQARLRGDLPPDTDVHHMADLLLDCWEGAALRSRLQRDPAPLRAMLDFHFNHSAA